MGSKKRGKTSFHLVNILIFHVFFDCILSFHLLKCLIYIRNHTFTGRYFTGKLLMIMPMSESAVLNWTNPLQNKKCISLFLSLSVCYDSMCVTGWQKNRNKLHPLLLHLMRKPAESVFSTIVDTLWKHPNIIIEKKITRAKYLQTNMLFILFPIWHWHSGPSVLSKRTVAGCS